jgi:hypothetical protein
MKALAKSRSEAGLWREEVLVPEPGINDERGRWVRVDNAMLGPSFRHPLVLGTALFVYSGMKYPSGLSDIPAGIGLAKDPDLIQGIRPTRRPDHRTQWFTSFT